MAIPVILLGGTAVASAVTGWFASGETAEITKNLSETADKSSNMIKWAVIAGIVYLLVSNMDLVRRVLK